MDVLNTINWELTIKIFAALVALLGAMYQLKNFKPGERAKLKADLEILEKIDKTDPNYLMIKRRIDYKVQKIYSAPKKDGKGITIYRKGDFWGGLICVIGFTFWSVRIYQKNDGFSFWLILTGFIVLAGLGGIISGLDKTEEVEQPVVPPGGKGATS